MASPDVVASALLLFVPFVSLALVAYNSLAHRSTPTKAALLLLLAILAAASGGTALSVACGQPLRIVTRVFTNLLHATLSGVSIYALGPSLQARVLPPPFLGFFLSLAGLLVACEIVSALIPTSPLLLPAILALVSRGILLTLSITTAILLRRHYAAASAGINIEKDQTPDDSSGKTSGRVSSPTLATWPFPGSLALQGQPKRESHLTNKSTPPDFPSSPPDTTCNLDEYAYKMDRQTFVLLPLFLTIAQVFATFSAALNVAASMLVDGPVSRTNQFQPHILLASAACTLSWSFMILVTIQILPAPPYSSEEQAAIDYEQRPLESRFSRDNPVTRTPKPSLSRRESDPLDFLSLRDPFASLPPPPPLPPVGLGLDEVDVGWNGNKEIGTQYRFPAPRSIVKGGRRKGKMSHVNGKKRLVHQDSARTLLPVLETRGTEADTGGDREFGDEARLAQLLLQSLSESGEDCVNPNPSTLVPTLQPCQVAHMQQCSRWSTSTTVQSIMSASISNRSGMSTYTTCASEKVPTSRISMNTVASALGSRKSSDARRKSAMTASSSKG